MYLRLMIIGLAFTLLQHNALAQDEEVDQKQKIKKAIERAVDKNLHYPLFPEKDSSQSAAGESKAQQTEQSQKDEQFVSDLPEAESEVHAAINPNDSSNIIVSPIKRNNQSLVTPVYYTKDFGKTWEESSFRAVPDDIVNNSGGGDPVITFDANGTAYISWLSFGAKNRSTVVEGIFWAFSNDGGQTWQKVGDQTIAKTFGESQRDLDTFYDKQWMTVDRTNSSHRNNLYVAYVKFDLNQQTRKIELKVKPADSNDFNENPISLTKNLNNVQFTDIKVTPNGDVHCTFQGVDPAKGKGLYHVKSTDGGKTFTQPQRVTSLAFPDQGAGSEFIEGVRPDRLYPCPHLAVDHSGTSSDGNLYMVWTAWGVDAQTTQNFDIYFSRSTDNGQTWESAKKLTQGSEQNDKFYPSIDVNNEGIITLSWYQQVDGALTHYYTAYSDNGGSSFKGRHAVSNAPTDFNTVGDQNRGFGIGEYTKVLSTNSQAIPIWTDGRDNDGDLNIMAAFIPFAQFEAAGTEYRNLGKDFTVNGPFPNPASESVQLTLNLEEANPVAIRITSMEGKVMKTIQHEQLAKGSHEMHISLNGLTNGSYFLKIQTDQGIAAKPLQVVK